MGRAARFTKTNIIAVAVVLSLVAGGGLWAVNRPAGTVEQDVSPAQTVAPSGYITYQGQQGKTALELLHDQADIQTEDSEFGEFVVAIDGNDGDGNKYWLLYVNGELASVGAGEYVTSDGDVIEWKLQ